MTLSVIETSQKLVEEWLSKLYVKEGFSQEEETLEQGGGFF